MAFNGSGVYVRLYSWQTDANSGIKILASRMDAETDGIATGLTTCVTRDGQSPATANLPMGGFRHTGCQDGVALTDYATLGQVYGSHNPSSLLVYVSQSTSLSAADTIAAGLGGTLIIDMDVTLSGDLTLASPMVWGAGGVITLGSHTLTISNILWAPEQMQIFNINSSGTVVLSTSRTMISACWFGAIGDGDVLAPGGTDNTKALTAWMTALGSGYYASTIVGPGIGYLPAGVYIYTATLTIPAQAMIYGVPSKSTLAPWSIFTGSKAVIASSGVTVQGIVIDGYLSSGISLFSIGASGLVSGGLLRQVQLVRALYFGSGTGYGLDVTQAAIWTFDDCDFNANSFGANIIHSTAGDPTTLSFINCRFKGNVRRGESIQTGQEIPHAGCIWELNGEEGAYYNVAGGGGGSAAVQNVLIGECGYFEANQQNAASGPTRHALYHAYLRGTKLKVRDAFFSHDANEARAIQLDQCVDGLVDHCDVANEAGQINVNGSSCVVQFTNWPTTNGTIATTVSVTNSGTATKYAPVSL